MESSTHQENLEQQQERQPINGMDIGYWGPNYRVETVVSLQNPNEMLEQEEFNQLMHRVRVLLEEIAGEGTLWSQPIPQNTDRNWYVHEIGDFSFQDEFSGEPDCESCKIVFNPEVPSENSYFYIRIRTTENRQKKYSETNKFSIKVGRQLAKIKNNLGKELYGLDWGDEDFIFYPVFRWEEDGAYTIHVIVNCLKKPKIGTFELQGIVTSLAQKYSVVAGAAVTGNINSEVLNDFGAFLMNYYDV